MSEVARLHRFHGRHHVPSLPAPWCEPHEHDYTVEVVARGDLPVVVDTDLIDTAWAASCPLADQSSTVDLDAAYGAENTTVEALAARWLAALCDAVPAVYRVVVWEDDARWGAAER